jgi:DNA-binding XRE family transcriptional regulator
MAYCLDAAPIMNFDLASPSEIRHELLQRLRAQRLAQALSQAELAARAGVGLASLKRLEAGDGTSLDVCLRVVVALGLAGQLQMLFGLQVQSIEQMAQLEQPPRQRAPRGRSRLRKGDAK